MKVLLEKHFKIYWTGTSEEGRVWSECSDPPAEESNEEQTVKAAVVSTKENGN